MTIKDLITKYISETVKHMDYNDLESFATRLMTETMEDMSDQEIFDEVIMNDYPELVNEYNEANEDEVNHYGPNINGSTYR